MARILYIVAQEQSLLAGYLSAKMDARSPEGHTVEIKVDERRGERRSRNQGRDPERRAGDRRHQPSLYTELRSRGYATVVQDDSESPLGVTPAGPTLGWRPRSTRAQRTARAWRRHGPRWALRAALLLIVIGLSIVVARSIRPTVNPTPGAAPPVEAESTLPSASPTEPASAPERPTPAPPSSHTPAPVVVPRAAGVVVSVDLGARTLVLQDLGATAQEARRLRVKLAPDARLVLSERAPEAADPTHPFKDTAITLADIQSGDFVVVEMRGHDGDALARSVVVTLQAQRGARGPTR